ncbi:hypothetical protein MKW94_020395 [Papaver nudicaule]|uniref:Uncharacterized protein n=1 Tax=Papaver nudicaule TaxID=74823 RepID=A0AA41VBF7_PAPNU|nr:hypothetical protein [Papaver nudicaule]
MAKISIFLSLFVFVLIAMPTSSFSRMLLQEVQEEAEFCPEFDPELQCANDWETGVICLEGQHPCRSNCGRTRCVAN